MNRAESAAPAGPAPAANEAGRPPEGSGIGSPPTAEEAGEAVGHFLGLPPLAAADLGHLGSALAISVVVALLTCFLAKRLRRWLERVVAPRFHPPGGQVGFPGRQISGAIASLLGLITLTIIASAYAWPAYSILLFDIMVSAAAAMLAWQVAAAFALSTSTRLALAILCGFQVLAARYEQLGWVGTSLDGLAVTVGESRISMLDIVNLIFAGIILYALIRITYGAVRAFIRRNTRLDITQSLLAEKLAAVGIGVIAIFIAIDLLGIDTTALSVFSGTVGLGLGFGLQKIFSNLVSGIILLMDRSIKPGDVIVVADAVGEVNRIGTRAVSVITRDGKEHLIPNELLMTERVENWNFSSRDIRIRMSVRVSYECDLDLVEELIREATRESPRVLDRPAAAVRITDISDNGVKLEIRFWIKDPEDGLGNIQSEIYKRLLVKFREHGIVMPNPAREIDIRRVPPISLKREDRT